jgi:hypothetical protein
LRFLADSSADTSPARINFQKASSGNLGINDGVVSAEVPLNSWGVITVTVDRTGASRIWRNGVELAGDLATAATTGVALNGICLASLRTGSGNHSQIDFALVEVYSGQASETNVLAYQRQLCDQYGLTWLGYR